jgi:LysR family transcriptional regulator, glycine cleavage system transcriptional activator
MRREAIDAVMGALAEIPDRKATARRRLPPLVALRAFEVVGRSGSVRAAAAELGVSHSAISRHIQNLQHSLGVVLVQGSGRGVALTEAGRDFHAKISRAFDAITHAAGSLRLSGPSPLNIWCVDGLAGWLVARLAGLSYALDNRDINLRTIASRADLANMEADAIIDYCDDDIEVDAALVVFPLYRPRVFPVASPTFLARCAPIEGVADLPGSVLLHEESTWQWERWLELAGVSDPPQLRGHRFSNAWLAIEAARCGHGIALANDILASHLLQSRALVEVASSDVCVGAYQFFARKKMWTNPAIVMLQHWLERALSVSQSFEDRPIRSGSTSAPSRQKSDQLVDPQLAADST